MGILRCLFPALERYILEFTIFTSKTMSQAMPLSGRPRQQVMVMSSDKTWSTGEGNGKPLQYSCLENPMNSLKKQKEH